ncbi:hypothetical protein D6201_04585 [Aurantiacibacter aquimixticola]|uniref:O-antigen polysaccharide polymerase Wzy n=1 Tax=Aurantiacibacter aquimixticola TaxID=1958945 RepID=A0A419RSH2_9SPHN|nr:hypothetical protein D6201_04585 [Aurantiacibacter aquimixticola]
MLGLNLFFNLLAIGFAMLPFLVKSFGGMPMGWLNPLALASAITIVKTVIQRPIHIVEPLVIWLREPVPLEHELLTYWSLDAIQSLEFKIAAMGAISLLAYHLGFFLFQTRRKSKRTLVREAPHLYFVIIFGLLTLAFVILIALSGGLATHFSNLALGRFGVRENTGVLLVSIGFMPYLLVIWYLLRPEIFRTPIFWAMLIFALALQFAADGSRSSVLIPMVVLTAGWIYRNRRIPALAGAIGIFVAILTLAILGQIRTDARQIEGDLETTSVLSMDVTEILQRNDEEVAERNWRQAGVAIAALVPRENAHLFGQTYVAAVLFWVPRSVWNEKPRGVGATANALLFLKKDTVEGFEGAAYPVGGPTEAFWNFGWFGIVAIYALFGVFHKFVALRVTERPQDVEAVVLLLLSVVSMADVATDQIVPFLQLFVLLKLAFFGLKMIASVPLEDGENHVTTLAGQQGRM